jgi:DNA-directed RNA polymerase specialized sigma24 family protein
VAQREAVLARVVAERDYAEIAAELECSEQVVLVALRAQAEEEAR